MGPPVPGGPLALALCCVVWFAANSAATVFAKLLFSESDPRAQRWLWQ